MLVSWFRKLRFCVLQCQSPGESLIGKAECSIAWYSQYHNGAVRSSSRPFICPRDQGQQSTAHSATSGVGSDERSSATKRNPNPAERRRCDAASAYWIANASTVIEACKKDRSHDWAEKERKADQCRRRKRLGMDEGASASVRETTSSVLKGRPDLSFIIT